MDCQLLDLLRKVGTESNNNVYSHLTTYDTKKRWLIKPELHSAFWKGYCDLVDQKFNGTDEHEPDLFAKLCLAEKPADVMPVMAQFVFKFHADEKDNVDHWEPYNDEFLAYLCYVYQAAILENF